tara:strand:+ start:279 stop:1931 length:1653 start_codon:yes stop_codon:yes gene_type:complete
MPDHYADDIYGDINRKKQLEDAQENKEFDRDIEAYRRGQGNLTDEERLERMKDITAKRKQLKDNLLRIINNPESQTLVKSNLRGTQLRAQKLRNKRIAEGNTGIPISEVPGKIYDTAIDFGESIAEDPAAISEHMFDFYTDFQAAKTGYSVAGPYGAVGAVVLKRGSDILGEKILKNIRRNARVVEALGTPTPEKYRRKILANQPITQGKQPGDYTVFELDLATRGPGIEGQGMPYDAAMRRRVEKVDYDLITELNLKYGGTPEQAREFLIYQKFAKKQVDEAVYKLNKKQRKIQIEDLKLHISKGEIKLSKAELKKAIRKINNTTYYNLGHIRSAKNVWRYEKLFGANRASNMFPEIEPNIEVFNKLTGKRERIVVHGNKSRGARMDIPDEILQMTGTSATIDEEYLKFIDPTISEWGYELLPKKLQDELLSSVQEKWKRFRSAGYSDFANYLQEVEGLSWYQFNKLPKNRIKSKNAPITQNDLRTKFNAQKEIVPGSQQLDTWKPFLRKSVDDFVHAQELKKEWSKLKKAGKDEQAADLLLEIGKLIN